MEMAILTLERYWRLLILHGEAEATLLKKTTLLEKLPASYAILSTILGRDAAVDYDATKAQVQDFARKLRQLQNQGQAPRDQATALFAGAGRGKPKASGGNGQQKPKQHGKPVKGSCGHCGDVGHYRRECPKLHDKGEPKFCWVCGSVEHTCPECPDRATAPKGAGVKALAAHVWHV